MAQVPLTAGNWARSTLAFLVVNGRFCSGSIILATRWEPEVKLEWTSQTSVSGQRLRDVERMIHYVA
jgi:hypothetical protein